MTDKKRTGSLDWEDIRYFMALVRHGTLSATARALHVNHATVSRRLASLEGSLGQPLFDRRPDGFVLNMAGRAVRDETIVMEEAASAAFRRVEAGTATVGLVRVTVIRSLADGFIAERLGQLLMAHPQLDIEIIAVSQNLSLARREADLALRLGQPAKGELLTRRVATLDYGFYASAAYAARIAAGEAPVFIGFDADAATLPEAAWLECKFPGQRFVARSNSQMAQAAMAAGGYGIALLPDWLARTRANLVALDMREVPPSRELWLVMRPDIARIPRVRLVADHLIGMFAPRTEQ